MGYTSFCSSNFLWDVASQMGCASFCSKRLVQTQRRVFTEKQNLTVCSWGINSKLGPCGLVVAFGDDQLMVQLDYHIVMWILVYFFKHLKYWWLETIHGLCLTNAFKNKPLHWMLAHGWTSIWSILETEIHQCIQPLILRNTMRGANWMVCLDFLLFFFFF